MHAYLKKHGFRDRDTDIVPAIDSGITIEPIKLETVPAAPKAMAEAKVTETTSTKSNATAEDTKPRLKVKEIKAKARVNERRADTDEAAPMALELGSFPSEATPSSGSTTAFVFDTTPTVGEKRGQEELGVLGEEVPVAPAARTTASL